MTLKIEQKKKLKKLSAKIMIDKKWGRKLKRKKSRPISLKSVSEKFKGPDIENTFDHEKCLVDRKLKRPRKRKRAIKKECHLNLKKCTISIKVSRYWSSKTLTWIKKKWHLAFDRKWGGWLSFLRGFLELFKGFLIFEWALLPWSQNGPWAFWRALSGINL